VQWKHFGPDDTTWKMEDAMRHAYPILFTFVHTYHVDRYNIVGDDSFKGEGIVTPYFPQSVNITIWAKELWKT
jgi:hypothetical protein